MLAESDQGPIYGELLDVGACDKRMLIMLFLVVERLRGQVTHASSHCDHCCRLQHCYVTKSSSMWLQLLHCYYCMQLAKRAYDWGMFGLQELIFDVNALSGLIILSMDRAVASEI